MNASANGAADRSMSPAGATDSAGLRSRVATFVVAGCLIAACSSGDEAAPVTPAPATRGTTGTSAQPDAGAPAVSVTTSPPQAAGTSAPSADDTADDTADSNEAPEPTAVSDAPTIDAPTVFAAALDGTAAGYRFASRITIGDQVAVTAEGDHIAGATQMRIVSQGVAVDYLVADGVSWVFDEGVWQELDDETAVADPLGPLADPLDVVVNGADGERIRLLAAYPAAALGLTGDDVGVIVEIVEGRIVSLEYATAIDDVPATVRADLSAPPDPAPAITAPDA